MKAAIRPRNNLNESTDRPEDNDIQGRLEKTRCEITKKVVQINKEFNTEWEKCAEYWRMRMERGTEPEKNHYIEARVGEMDRIRNRLR